MADASGAVGTINSENAPSPYLFNGVGIKSARSHFAHCLPPRHTTSVEGIFIHRQRNRAQPCSHNVPVLLPPSVLHAGRYHGVFSLVAAGARAFLFQLVVNACSIRHGMMSPTVPARNVGLVLGAKPGNRIYPAINTAAALYHAGKEVAGSQRR